ncbi:hypothetical protein B0H11DRAFT_2248829 [Mycena galericulata]|nr:hypothetical protein B0H11DRAFT_2248829 [Mycena galericulata]
MPPGCLSPRCRYARPLAAGRSPTPLTGWCFPPDGSRLSSPSGVLPILMPPGCLSPSCRYARPLAAGRSPTSNWLMLPAGLSTLFVVGRAVPEVDIKLPCSKLSRERTDRPDPPRPRLLVHPPPTPGRPAVLPPTARTASCDQARPYHPHLFLADGWVAHWTDRPRSAGTKTQVHLPPTLCRPAAPWPPLALLVGMSPQVSVSIVVLSLLRRPPFPSTPPSVETSVEVRGTKTSSPPPAMLVRTAIPSPALALLARKTFKHRLHRRAPSLLRLPTIPLGAVPR